MNPSSFLAAAACSAVLTLQALAESEGSFNPAVAKPICFDLPASSRVVGAELTSYAKLVVVAQDAGSGAGSLWRFTMDGARDLSFQPFTGFGFELEFRLKVFRDGEIWIPVNRRLTQLNADGTVDGNFQTSSWSQIYKLDEAPDGSKYVAGAGQWGWSVFRVLRDGSRDPSFTAPTWLRTVRQLEITSEGAIYIRGDSGEFRNSQSHFLRLNSDGSVDETFTSDFGDIIRAIGPEVFGRFGGGKYDPGAWVRFLPTGEMDPNFTPVRYTTISNRTLPVRDALGRFYSMNRDGDQLNGWLRRFDANGALDPTFAQLDIDNCIIPRTFIGFAEGDLLFVRPHGDVLNGFDSTCNGSGSVMRIPLTPPHPRVVIADTVATNRAGTTLSETLPQRGIDVARTGPNDDALTIRYRARNGSAIGGADFAPANGELRFDPGTTRALLTLEAVNDDEVEGWEYLFVDFLTAKGETVSTIKVWLHSDESFFALETAEKQPDGSWRIPLRESGETVALGHAFALGYAWYDVPIVTEGVRRFLQFTPTDSAGFYAPISSARTSVLTVPTE